MGLTTPYRPAPCASCDALRAEVAALRAAIAQYEADARDAAGELLVPIPTPGTDAAKVMVASRIMRGQRDEARAELADLRRKMAARRKTKRRVPVEGARS